MNSKSGRTLDKLHMNLGDKLIESQSIVMDDLRKCSVLYDW